MVSQITWSDIGISHKPAIFDKKDDDIILDPNELKVFDYIFINWNKISKEGQIIINKVK